MVVKRNKKVRGEPVTVAAPKDKPHCIVHIGSEMVFDPKRLVWKCPEFRCPQIAQPVTDLLVPLHDHVSRMAHTSPTIP
jgi:hypothetical protein